MATLEDQARAVVALAPFWGVAPGSNRWPDLALSEATTGKECEPGEAVEYAIRQGWLRAEQHEQPGYVMPDDPEGGTLDCHWRYYAAAPPRQNHGCCG